MNRAQFLAQRRSLLTTECALQRITLASQTQSLSGVSWIKTSSNLVNRLKKLPLWTSALLGGLVLFDSKRAIGYVKNGLLIYQLWRTVFSKPSI